MNNLKGIYVAMVTPMKKDESLDEEGIKLLTDTLINAGVNGLCCLGTAGEFYALNEREKEKVVKLVVDKAKGRVKVIPGAGGIATRDVCHSAKKFQKLGADALIVVTPYYITPSQDELYEHYKTIALSVDIPVVLYNIPSFTGVQLLPDTVKRLSRIPNIIGIKDSSGNFDNIKEYKYKTSADFSVMAGTDSFILDTLKIGGKGGISATANIVPKTVVSIYKNFQKGNMEKAAKYQQKITDLRKILKLGTAPGIVKEAVNITGIPVGPPRSPVTAVSGGKYKELKDVILQYKR